MTPTSTMTLPNITSSPLEIILQDPSVPVSRKYTPRTSAQTWQAMYSTILRMYERGFNRTMILEALQREHNFRTKPRQLWKQMREWGMFVYDVGHRKSNESSDEVLPPSRPSRTTSSRTSHSSRQSTPQELIPYALPDPFSGLSTRPVQYYSWSLSMPDYYEHKLWTLLSLRTAPVWRSQCRQPRPFIVRHMRSRAVLPSSTGSNCDYRPELSRIFSMSRNPLLMPEPEKVMAEAMDLGRMQELLQNLRMWLCCPFVQTESLRWMFLVMLDLALRSSVMLVIGSVEEDVGKGGCGQKEVKVHLEAAGQMLSIIHRKMRGEREKSLLTGLADVLETCQGLVLTDEWKVHLAENRPGGRLQSAVSDNH